MSKLNFPFSFDGHGVNDANGQRLLTISIEKYPNGRERDPRADVLGKLGAGAPNLLRALVEAEKSLRKAIEKDPNAGQGGMNSELYPAWAFANRVLDEVDVDVEAFQSPEDEN